MQKVVNDIIYIFTSEDMENMQLVDTYLSLIKFMN